MKNMDQLKNELGLLHEIQQLKIDNNILQKLLGEWKEEAIRLRSEQKVDTIAGPFGEMPYHTFGRPCEQLSTPYLPLTLHRHAKWSEKTFGPGPRTAAILDHIRKELIEIEAEPYDLEEWVDLLLLSFDGARRAGNTPEEIIQFLADKLEVNIKRNWPDWREVDTERAIEHIAGGV